MTNIVQFPGLGWEFEINNVLVQIGGFRIYWYGFIIACGLLLALLFGFRNARRFGINTDRMTDVIIVAVICGVVGARAYYVIFSPYHYTSLWQMINLRDGGLAIYGGIIGGFLGGLLMCRARKVPVLPMFDVAAMGYLIGQGIGRWGNFFNQEAFGINTTLPWGMYSASTHNYLMSVRGTLAQQGVTVDPSLPVHPTFLYESLWCLLGFLLLRLYMKHRRFNGEIFLFYIIWYGTGRFFFEGLRTDSLMTPLFNLRVSQLLALASVAVALAAWAVLRRRFKGVPLAVPNPDAPINDKKKQRDAKTQPGEAAEPEAEKAPEAETAEDNAPPAAPAEEAETENGAAGEGALATSTSSAEAEPTEPAAHAEDSTDKKTKKQTRRAAKPAASQQEEK